MKNLKVIHIVETLGTGGIEKVLETLIPVQSQTPGFNVSILCLLSGGRTADRLSSSGIKADILGFRDCCFLERLFLLRKYLKENEPDIIHTHNHSAGVYGRAAAIGLGAVLFHHLHNARERGLLKLLKEKLFAGFTARIFCCSDFVLRYAETELGIPQNKLLTVYNGVDPGRVDYYRQNYKGRLRERFKTEDKIAAIVGSLHPHKGVLGFLKSSARLFMENKVTLIIAGSGPDSEELGRIIDNEGLKKKVILAGEIDNPYEIYPDIDILIAPSLTEGLGLAAIEAQAFGIPVIANAGAGGISEVVMNGVTGFLIDIFDCALFGEKILSLISDDSLYGALSVQARENAMERFNIMDSWGQIKKEYAGK